MVLLYVAVAIVISVSVIAVLYASKLFGPKTELWIADEAKYVHFEEGKRTERPFPSSLAKATNPPKDLLHLSVVVPAYDEEKRLNIMVDEALVHLKKRQAEDKDFTWEMIIVDDGSKDKTTQVALEYTKQEGSERVRVLSLKKNRGKGGALRRGVICTRGKYVLMVDADGATLFSDFDRLEEKLKKLVNEDHNVPGVAVGSRAHLQDEAVAQRTLFRTILMYGFHFLLSTIAVRGIKDTQCGFKLFTRKSARMLFPNLHIERWAFDIELIIVAQALRTPMVEIPVNWQEIPGSKLSPMEAAIQMLRDVLRIRFGYLFGYWSIDKSLYRD